MKRRLADESGVTLVEMLFTILILGIVVAALANVFVSGLRANADSSARTADQGTIRTTFDRLEFEARCSSGATVGGSGANVTLTLPSQCAHASGSYTWCVAGGQLLRYAGTDCSTGTGQVFASGVTTATPFTLLTATGLLPRLQIALKVNEGHASGDAVSLTDILTLRNAARS
jgi:prepilin-type N-terminal cleavage/methylation domain-containing protein